MKILFFTYMVLVALTNNAHAYLDPGTGSYVLQTVIAGILGGLFTLKIWWRRIAAFFSRIFKGQK